MPPPDYWPDARRIPKEKLRRLVETVRAAREALGLSNAELCREVRALIHAHNKVPGRKLVHVKAISEDWEYDEQGKYELGAMLKGTRKYIVGYLAWLCLRDEDAARAFYEEMRLPFRPYHEDEQADGPTSSDPEQATTRDDEDAPIEARGKDEFFVYEIAFLWYGKRPPQVQAHESAMTPEIERMKSLLHKAIDLGRLSAVHFQAQAGGYARRVQRDDLQRFAQEIGIFPSFLFPDRERSSDDTNDKLANLEAELDELLLQLPKAVTDWAEEYARNEWAIYEAAFLWHGFAPPPASLHERVMPEAVQRTKRMLHDAANANALTPAIDEGLRMRSVMVYGTRYVSRPELRRFAAAIGQWPRFLFPEEYKLDRAT